MQKYVAAIEPAIVTKKHPRVPTFRIRRRKRLTKKKTDEEEKSDETSKEN